MGIGNDRNATKIKEKVWVTKVDHETDPPTVVETVFVGENIREVGGTSGEETGTEAAAQAADVQADYGHEVDTAIGKLNPWKTVAAVGKAAEVCGIDLEVALRFMSVVSAEIKKQLKTGGR